MPLTIIYQGSETQLDDDATAVIGSDASSTIRIVRPGISRKHAIVTHDGSSWKIQDAGSRNGTFSDGERVQVQTFDDPLTVFLGHPVDGERLSLVPETAAPPAAADLFTPPDEASSPDPAPAAPAAAATAARATEPTRVQPASTSASDVELAQLTAAIRDQISAVKGLTWSVWAMIAVTAALIVLTLFVGILSN